ncbi:MAG TPA: hypothetical protein VJ761_10750 [Ktedonobacteraceae bacterium]|nr:hypothetical protein [Ktedonobacteraceae bacterium]
MYYRVAIQREADQPDRAAGWQWKSTLLSSLESVLHWLRLYSALSQDRLRVFSSFSRECLEEQLRQENKGLGFHSATAAQFLQQRMIRLPEGRQATAERGTQGQQERVPIVVPPRTQEEETSRAVSGVGVGSKSLIERRQIEQELGKGSDHDVPYHFVLPASPSQVLAWMRLLARVQRGELQP